MADTVVDENKDSSVLVHVVAAEVFGGIVAVAIVCMAVIIVLRKRGHNATLAGSRGVYEIATPGVLVTCVEYEELVFYADNFLFFFIRVDKRKILQAA